MGSDIARVVGSPDMDWSSGNVSDEHAASITSMPAMHANVIHRIATIARSSRFLTFLFYRPSSAYSTV